MAHVPDLVGYLVSRASNVREGRHWHWPEALASNRLGSARHLPPGGGPTHFWCRAPKAAEAIVQRRGGFP